MVAGWLTLPAFSAVLSGPVTNELTLTFAEAVYQAQETVVVAPGAILRVEPGVRIELGPSANLEIQDGARLLVEGTAHQPVVFGPIAGRTDRWGGLRVFGSTNSPETRLKHARIEGNNAIGLYSFGGTLWLEHVTFGATDRTQLSLDGCSFVISHCVFPAGTAPVELLHGRLGIKAGGVGIIRHSYFGSTLGYNDAVDFTGGNRPAGPILQVLHNVFMGSADDILDLDGTDAWIEGNIFLHAHRNGAPDSSAAISGSAYGFDTSEITIINNLFFDCDHAVTAKEWNFYALINNTIVRTTRAGGLDTDSGVVAMQDLEPRPSTFGVGCYLEGNIIVDAERLVRNYDPAQSVVTFVNNILPQAWAGPGRDNWVGDAKLRRIPELAETQFATWQEAQILREWFSPGPDSPAKGRDRAGLDLGAQAGGVRISGEPAGVTSSPSATLRVVGNYPVQGFAPNGWPAGAGYDAYRWRLPGGVWSETTPVAQPIELRNLPAGEYSVEIIGRNDAGFFQNDERLGAEAAVTRSKVWRVVASPAVNVRVNEAGGAGGFTVSFVSTGGRFVIEAAFSLVGPVWEPLVDAMTTPGQRVEFPVSNVGPGRYFRLRHDRAAEKP